MRSTPLPHTDTGPTAPHLRAVVGPVHGIGPNAITRLSEVLDLRMPAAANDVFASAGLTRYRLEPPTEMVDEREVVSLHLALRDRFDEAERAALAFEAGLRTGDYLLAHRIPRPAQWVLKRLPPRLAAQALLRAIGSHAWTFAGSGSFTWEIYEHVELTIRHCPLARGIETDRPACDYFAGTFQRLFAKLVDPATTVIETTCEAMGDTECRFLVRWV
ncbi:MAG: bacteriochlorophyll 4-vinyl reductase [Pseudomonadota bacterium]